MDVFALREKVVDEYRSYVESFVRVRDDRVDQFVRDRLHEGALWPDAVLQLNPAYVAGQTLGELASAGTITDETAKFFSPALKLHQHQSEAIDIAKRNEPYVVTTGTGSGKSLTYLLPIYDSVIRNQPEKHTVRAIIIYPMNALINSQGTALKRYLDENFPDSPVRFAKYTGETSNEERQQLINDPPHVLLTNYVMLEYLLLRPADRRMLQTAIGDLEFLVMDELHFYRGRQGADVSMLLRRVSERSGRELLHIGTSATMATGNNREERRQAVAEVAGRVFGTDVPPANIIEETLRRSTDVPSPVNRDDIRSAVQSPPPDPTPESVSSHPLAAWAESALGIEELNGELVRKRPVSFVDAVTQLSESSGLGELECSAALRLVLEAGNAAETAPEEPVFAFRLHQWLSSGGSVHTTLEDPESRQLTMEAQYRADESRLYYPLAFCRECGQDYYMVTLVDDQGVARLEPRAPLGEFGDEIERGVPGFFALENPESDEPLWEFDFDDLPEHWYRTLKRGPVVNDSFEAHIPQEFNSGPDGSTGSSESGRVSGWFQPSPFLLCLQCRAVYDKRQRDFTKLSSLSQIGRSTATTVAVTAGVTGMVEAEDVDDDASKILSFTDNRQDASLQAGHLNDFVQVAQVRAAIVEALSRTSDGRLSYDQLPDAMFSALAPRPEDFMREPVPSGPGHAQAKRALIDLFKYLALDDLTRGWRVAQPNLEQTGLVKIEYFGLADLAVDDDLWEGVPQIGAAAPEERLRVLRSFLDHIRTQLAINSESLSEQSTRSLVSRATDRLREPWSLESDQRLKRAGLARLPELGTEEIPYELRAESFGTGRRSALLRYMRNRHTWDVDDNLSIDEGIELIKGIMEGLRGHLLVSVTDDNGTEIGVRIFESSLVWSTGNGQAAEPDPVRTRSLHMRRNVSDSDRTGNQYFTGLYQTGASLRGMLAGEHSGQVSADNRARRETLFRNGELPILFCSPTMELGVDISNLYAVHMRNVPPTPANYAQRSGRAGRGGRPALITVFAGQGNSHDQHYFRNSADMIAGSVAPARIELRNRELVEAHIRSSWLAESGLSLHHGMADLIDLHDDALPLNTEIRAQIQGTALESRALDRANGIVGRASEITESNWFSDDWITDVVRRSIAVFDAAFDRWRELYRSALRRREEATQRADDPSLNRRDREVAERQRAEARREVGLLLNQSGRQEESDFYPYRYLAGEGFLPGYNFPRLPVQALVSYRDRTDSIQRPRFLGLSEFGPQNYIYHEGRRHQVSYAVLSTSDVDSQLIKARLCNRCGYAHFGDSVDVDCCLSCGVNLDADTSQYPQKLFSQPTVKAFARERISSEEETRQRYGYRISTHFAFPPGSDPTNASVVGSDGESILNVTFSHAADIWRINHGWRRSDTAGFSIEPASGKWSSRAPEDVPDSEDPNLQAPLHGITPYVRDTRNLLLLRPSQGDHDESSLITLLYALKLGIEAEYQLESQEVAAELIGEAENRRLMLWEAVEGGTGVWERLVEEPSAMAIVARAALARCHFDENGNDLTESEDINCVAACYECLLSYSNQPSHRHLDRSNVRELLMALASATTERATQGRTREEHIEWLRERTDPASPLESQFINYLYENGYRLPDEAQVRPANDIYSQPDFYYRRGTAPGACVFVDGASHLGEAQAERDENARAQLANRGFTVVTIRFDLDVDEQLAAYGDVFGYNDD